MQIWLYTIKLAPPGIKQLQLVLWLLNGNWTGAIDYVFWNAASKNNNNISQFLACEFWFFSLPQKPNWKLWDGAPSPPPPLPHFLQTHVYILLPPNLLKCHEVSKHVSFYFWSQHLRYGVFLSHSHLQSTRSPGFHALGSLHWMQTFCSSHWSTSITEPFHPAINPHQPPPSPPALWIFFPILQEGKWDLGELDLGGREVGDADWGFSPQLSVSSMIL